MVLLASPVSVAPARVHPTSRASATPQIRRSRRNVVVSLGIGGDGDGLLGGSYRVDNWRYSPRSHPPSTTPGSSRPSRLSHLCPNCSYDSHDGTIVHLIMQTRAETPRDSVRASAIAAVRNSPSMHLDHGLLSFKIAMIHPSTYI